MRIKHIDFWPVEMKLKVPYTISYEKITSTTNVFLALETNKGIIGTGCAAPDKEVTNETAPELMKQLDEMVKPILQNADPLRAALILSKIKQVLPASPSLLAVVDMALYDILGKTAGIPLYKMLGGYRSSMKTSITIGILSLEETVQQAEEFVLQGFKCLKIKGGADVDEDIERMIRTREVVGNKIELRFDANQGYNVEETLRFVEATKKVKIELLEQPTSKKKPELLGDVTQKTHIPVMADESIMNHKDVFRLARKNYIDMVNIKIMKVGGIYESIAINAISRSANLEVMVGCMDEATLGIAAGLHFALSSKNVHYADLDGHFDLIGDPSSGVTLKSGVLYPSDEPGLGCKLQR